MQDNTTDKELVLQAMREYGRSKAAQLQEASAEMTGDCCTDGGKVWRSAIDNNVWAHTAYPRGWEEVTGTDTPEPEPAPEPEPGTEPEPGDGEEDIPAFVQPTGAHDAYQTGDRVTYNGHIYESTINNNVWSPDAYPQGWTDLGAVEEGTA